MKPNVFDFATSELSQDAMLCWLVAWAHPVAKSEDEKLHGLGTGFIAAICSKFGLASPVIRNAVNPNRQENKIDVTVLIDEWPVVCIEDKAGSKKKRGPPSTQVSFGAIGNVLSSSIRIVRVFPSTCSQPSYINPESPAQIASDANVV